jgi:hypothetical protein
MSFPDTVISDTLTVLGVSESLMVDILSNTSQIYKKCCKNSVGRVGLLIYKEKETCE